MIGTRSGVGLGACAALMVGLAAVARAAAITYDGWTRYAAQSRISEAQTYIERVQAVTASTIGVAASLVALALAGIVFVRWLQRAWIRSAAMATTPLRYGLEWTVGAWLVPVYNLVAPPKVVAEIWRASAGDRKASAAPVSDWWTAVIITCALDLYAMITDDAYLAAAARTIEGVVTLIAAWMLIVIIARVTLWQMIAGGRRNTGAAAPAAAISRPSGPRR
jgi:hypothetical protein